jgi:hypothetical protein
MGEWAIELMGWLPAAVQTSIRLNAAMTELRLDSKMKDF